MGVAVAEAVAVLYTLAVGLVGRNGLHWALLARSSFVQEILLRKFQNWFRLTRTLNGHLKPSSSLRFFETKKQHSTMPLITISMRIMS